LHVRWLHLVCVIGMSLGFETWLSAVTLISSLLCFQRSFQILKIVYHPHPRHF
jgi:hypothetical protein